MTETRNPGPVENLPDGTAHVVTLRPYNAPPPDEDDLEDDFVGPSEVTEFQGMREGRTSATYHPGDELPLDLAGRVFGTPQSEVLACFDEDGRRLDEPDRRELGYKSDAERAINEWGRQRFDDWTEYSYDEDFEDVDVPWGDGEAA